MTSDVAGSDAQLGAAVRDALPPAASVTLQRIANHGGFENASYAVRAGSDRYHLKVGAHARIRTAWDVRDILRSRYRAPEQVAWLELPGEERTGVLSRWVEGASPQTPEEAPIDELAATLSRLHADAELADRLGRGEASCAQAYRESYDRRFRADLELVRSRRPDFVAPALVEWMDAEAGRLLEVVEAASFAEPAARPVHADPWLENVLVEPGGAWWLIDWDRLGLGDPAADWAMLFGPSRGDPRPAARRTLPQSVPAAPGLRERLAVLSRATQLDWILDPLADWIVSFAEGEGEDVRRDRERIHRQSLRERLEGPDPPPDPAASPGTA